jgi:transposase-like protein
MSGRSVPFHCPYCGGEDLRPHEVAQDGSAGAGHGAWECHSCLRAFRVSLIGQLRPPDSVAASRKERRP